ncbi:hypothetical protein [[Kitasatospora] papulosa]|uniref:hypothetical protein n=1 Tax=[Kitasatospora] papulosa TaxID=1464011 RepID=UPI0036CB84EE
MSARPKITTLYAENASPDSIRNEITKARATRDRWQRHVDELARLLDTRLGQIDAGTWPPTPDHATEEPTPLAVGDRYECRTRPRTVTVTRLWVDEYSGDTVAFEWRGGMSGAAHTVDMFHQLYRPAL